MNLKGKKIYISGKMNGLSPGQIGENFYNGEAKLLKAGALPVSPYKVDVPYMSYEELMQIDFRLIDLCDGVLMLDNWTDSAGAKRERAYAIAIRKPVYEEDGNGKLIEV